MFSKVVLICLVVILAGLILFLGGYLVSSRRLDQTATIAELPGFDPQPQRSESSVPRLRRLSTVKAAAPALSEDGKKILFFEHNSGKVLASDFLGKGGAVISGKIISNFSSARWSPNGTEALLTQISRGSPALSYFNLKNGQLLPLHSFISESIWSWSGKKIAYLFFDEAKNEGQISMANPDGSIFKNILPTRVNSLVLSWPKENRLTFYNRNGDQSLFVLEMEEAQLSKIFGPVSQLQILWSPDASRGWFSYLKDGEKRVSIFNLTDKTETTLNLLTEATKCAWSANGVYLYCGARLSAEEPEKIYVIDTTTQQIKVLFSPSFSEDIDVANPLLTPAEDFLIFLNNYDQYLYSVSL